MAAPAPAAAAEKVWPAWLKPNTAPVRYLSDGIVPGTTAEKLAIIESAVNQFDAMYDPIQPVEPVIDVDDLGYNIYLYLGRRDYGYGDYGYGYSQTLDNIRSVVAQYILLRVLLRRPEISTQPVIDRIIRTVCIFAADAILYDWMCLTFGLVSFDTVKQSLEREMDLTQNRTMFDPVIRYMTGREKLEYDHRMGRSMTQVASSYLEENAADNWPLDISTIVGSYLTNEVSTKAPIFPRPLDFSQPYNREQLAADVNHLAAAAADPTIPWNAVNARAQLKRILDQLPEEEEKESDRGAKRGKK